MKEYCVDLELAKELKEAEFPQKSEKWWNQTRYGYELQRQKGYCYPLNYPAPTSDELLNQLPAWTDSGQVGILKEENSYRITFFINDEVNYEDGYKEFNDKKLSNALAKMWLYLKKEGYIK